LISAGAHVVIFLLLCFKFYNGKKKKKKKKKKKIHSVLWQNAFYELSEKLFIASKYMAMLIRDKVKGTTVILESTPPVT
jgi:hypothetical protein